MIAKSVHKKRHAALIAERIKRQAKMFAISPDTGHAPGHKY